MAAFDQGNRNQPQLQNEKSAFDDDGGDLGSDIDDDVPKLGGGDFQHQSSINKSMAGIDMQMRN